MLTKQPARRAKPSNARNRGSARPPNTRERGNAKPSGADRASARQPRQTRAQFVLERGAARDRTRREWLRSTVEAGLIAFVFFFFIWPVKISGASMLPAFADGDRAFMSRVAVYFRHISRGDIVICRSGDETSEKDAEKSAENNTEKDIVKRVIGLPGERVTISSGAVFINGAPLSENYIAKSSPTLGETDVLLGADEYFIMGDNRANSRDSRTIGPVRKKTLVGKVFFRFFPLLSMKKF